MSTDTSAWWPAPRAERPVDATVSLPSSKSLTNRALVLAAIAPGPSILHRPLVARDTELMAAALRALGTSVTAVSSAAGGDGWRVEPAALHGAADVDCGLAGTVMRFVPPLAALARGPVRLDGDPRARERPLAEVVIALRNLGVRVDLEDGRSGLPVTVHGTGSVRGGVVELDASASSQFVSGLLLVGARFDEGVDVRHRGGPLPSLPYVRMTVTELRRRGVEVDDEQPDRWVVRPGGIAALDCVVEPDLSSGAPLLAAALVTGGRVRVRAWPERTDQAGDRLRELLAAMGADVYRDGTDLVVSADAAIEGLTLDLHDVGELVPVLAVLCALADAPSRLTGLAHLRGHESDRLAAIAAEVNALGGAITELADGLHVDPRPLRPGRWHTYDDHRMAQAGAVLSLGVPGLKIEDVETTAKTFPGFVNAWTELLR